MRIKRLSTVLSRTALFLLFLMDCLLIPTLAQAQTPTDRVIAYAALPAGTMTDGPEAGNSLGGKPINGIHLPFDSQPIGSITGIIPSTYPNYWLVIVEGQFKGPSDSSDFLLRIYTVQLDSRRANGGSGDVNMVNWYNLSDPDKKFAGIKNSTGTRILSGADFAPQALQMTKDGTFWIAANDASNAPFLLHFSANGRFMDKPFSLGGAGTLSGLSIANDGQTLIVAQAGTASGQVVFRRFSTTAKQLTAQPFTTYQLEQTSYKVDAIAMLNKTMAVVIEQDGKVGTAAAFKQVFLADISGTQAKKTALIDLLKIPDPNNLAKQGAVLSLPYSDISAIYPSDDQTLVIVNNNHVPFGSSRAANTPDPTEYVAVQVPQSLGVDAIYLRALR